MQDEGKTLAQVYELILGHKVMNAIAGIHRQNETLAVQIMGIALKARFGDIPTEEAGQEIDLLAADFKRSQESADKKE